MGFYAYFLFKIVIFRILLPTSFTERITDLNNTWMALVETAKFFTVSSIS